MKRVFVCFEQHRDASGKLTVDAEGATYLRPHTHPLLKGKEFATDREIFETINDNDNAADAKGRAANDAFKGEVIILQVLTF